MFYGFDYVVTQYEAKHIQHTIQKTQPSTTILTKLEKLDHKSVTQEQSIQKYNVEEIINKKLKKYRSPSVKTFYFNFDSSVVEFNLKNLSNKRIDKIKIKSHASDLGSNEYNFILSKKRGHAVLEKLKVIYPYAKFKMVPYGKTKCQDKELEKCQKVDLKISY